MDISDFIYTKFPKDDQHDKLAETETITMTKKDWKEVQAAVIAKPKLEERLASWIDYAYSLKGIIGELSWKNVPKAMNDLNKIQDLIEALENRGADIIRAKADETLIPLRNQIDDARQQAIELLRG